MRLSCKWNCLPNRSLSSFFRSPSVLFPIYMSAAEAKRCKWYRWIKTFEIIYYIYNPKYMTHNFNILCINTLRYKWNCTKHYTFSPLLWLAENLKGCGKGVGDVVELVRCAPVVGGTPNMCRGTRLVGYGCMRGRRGVHEILSLEKGLDKLIICDRRVIYF